MVNKAVVSKPKASTMTGSQAYTAFPVLPEPTTLPPKALTSSVPHLHNSHRIIDYPLPTIRQSISHVYSNSKAAQPPQTHQVHHQLHNTVVSAAHAIPALSHRIIRHRTPTRIKLTSKATYVARVQTVRSPFAKSST